MQAAREVGARAPATLEDDRGHEARARPACERPASAPASVLESRRTYASDQGGQAGARRAVRELADRHRLDGRADRKSTRLNSSHANISYAVFCLKKKTTEQ